MKILIISPLMLAVPDVQGGAIERLITMLLEQNEIHKKVELCVVSVFNAEAERIASKYKSSKVVYIRNINKTIQLLYAYFRAAMYKFLKVEVQIYDLNFLKVMKILSKEKPDIIVMEGGGGENLCLASKYYGSKKFYLHLHHKYDSNKIIGKTYGNVISVSNFILDEWMKKNTNKDLNTYIVPNCIDNNRFQKKISEVEYKQLREELGYAEEDFVVIYCGRIIPEKGIRELLKAFKLVDNENIKLLMIGSPNFAVVCETKFSEEIDERIKKMDNVQWIGYINNDNLYRYYQISDLMIVPSICEEASGLVVIEGMTSGLPILATRSGGLPENVSSKCAVLVERDEDLSEKLAESINWFYQHPEQRKKMADAALKKSEDFFIEKYYQDFMEVFENE